MTYSAAILSTWQDVEVLPGAYVVLFSETADAAVVARRAGFEVRDTLLVMQPGPRTSFAHLLRKPLVEKSTTEQVLATGTGAINIDGCRIGTSGATKRGSQAPYPKKADGTEDRSKSLARTGHEIVELNLGRWPTNIMLVHGPTCRSVGSKKIPGHKGYPNGPGGKSYQYSSDKRGAEVRPNAWAGHADADGTETIAAYECGPDCPVGLMNVMSGERPATLTGRADPEQMHGNPGDNGGASWFGGGNSQVYADSGGAARYYVQVQDDAEVLIWLRRLIEPPTGDVFVQPQPCSV